MRGFVRLVGASVLAILLAARLNSDAPRHLGEPTGPKVWLWAWERPEDLRFLRGRRDVGVAFLARTVVVGTAGVEPIRRRQPLLLPAGIERVAVVRVVVKKGAAGVEAHAAEAAREIVAARSETGTSALQIDYDARPSEYSFYRALLAGVRALSSPGQPLSITAMASWCLHDGALPDLGNAPVDIVPMFFAMGPGAPAARLALSVRGDFAVTACRGAIGVATDEPSPRLPARPVWAFQRRAWTEADVVALVERESP